VLVTRPGGAALAFIRRHGSPSEFLTVWNRNYKSFALPGGKREHNETHLAACVREVHEETGLVVTTAIPFHTFLFRPADPTSVIIVYACDVRGTPAITEPGSPWAWLTEGAFALVSKFGIRDILAAARLAGL
jgi:8-oxo-dGTP pyrophosphatase MutT (NUDIX family)